MARALTLALLFAACARNASDAHAPARDPMPPDLAALARSGEAEASVVYDDTISNERTYLDVAPTLAKRAVAARVYVGVGPEQNFTYIAIARPSVAFIVDYRRDNFLLHVAYRALFEIADTRLSFLCMLLARPCGGAIAGDAGAVIAAADAQAPSLAERKRTRDAIVARVRAYDLGLGDYDIGRMIAQLDVFVDRQLGGPRGEPTFRELLAARGPGGHGSFLASDEAFRSVQALERAGRVVPIVGDFAGERAFAAIAAWMRAHAETIGVLYASNVEQDLDASAWTRWIANARALPHDARSIAVRATVGDASATRAFAYDAFVARASAADAIAPLD